MKQQPSLKRNYIYRSIYEILVIIIPFITTPYISRVLGADGVGTYSYTSSIMTYFTLFAGLGTASYGAREIAQHRDDAQQASKLFWEIELMSVFTSLVCLAAWGIVVLFGRGYRPYFLALTPVLLGTMLDISWFFTGFEQIKYTVSLNIVSKLLGVALIFAFVKRPEDLRIYITVTSLTTLLGSASMWAFLPKLLVKTDLRCLSIKRHFHETLIYFIPTIAASIYTVLDKTLIGLITHDGFQNGYYEQAGKIMGVVKTFTFVSINFVTGVRVSYLFSHKKFDEIRERICNSMDFILFLGFAGAFGVCAVASKFVPTFFGAGYEPVIGLLYLMSPLVLIIGVSNCLGCLYYTPSGQRKRSAKYIIIGSFVNLICNILMIPRMGAQGAVIGSIVAESVITLLYLGKCDGYMTASLIWKMSWKRIIAACVMYAGVYHLGTLVTWPNAVTVIAQVAFGAVLYTGLLLILNDHLLHEQMQKGSNLIHDRRRR